MIDVLTCYYNLLPPRFLSNYYFVFFSVRKQNHLQNGGNGLGEPQKVNDTPTDTVPKPSKSAGKHQYLVIKLYNYTCFTLSWLIFSVAIGVDDAEDKSKHPQVQRKGRFKVMSETVDSEKVHL